MEATIVQQNEEKRVLIKVLSKRKHCSLENELNSIDNISNLQRPFSYSASNVVTEDSITVIYQKDIGTRQVACNIIEEIEESSSEFNKKIIHDYSTGFPNDAVSKPKIILISKSNILGNPISISQKVPKFKVREGGKHKIRHVQCLSCTFNQARTSISSGSSSKPTQILRKINSQIRSKKITLSESCKIASPFEFKNAMENGRP